MICSFPLINIHLGNLQVILGIRGSIESRRGPGRIKTPLYERELKVVFIGLLRM